MNKTKVALLIENVLGAMRGMQLSEKTVQDYKSKAFNAIGKYHDEKGTEDFSESHTTDFVEIKRAGFQDGFVSERCFRKIRRAADMLIEFNKTGALEWKTTKWMTLPSTRHFRGLLDSFLSSLNGTIADGTINGIRSIASNFLCYLEDAGHKDIQDASTNDIRSYLIDVSGKNPRGMGNIIYALRKLWKHLNETGAAYIEASVALQKPAGPHIKILPCFSKEEVNSLLLHSKDGSARGTRNHAILLLAAHTGLRLVDIVNMKLSDIDWQEKKIQILQRKTSHSLSLPLDTSVGNAIAEYILNFRPDTQSPYIFLRTAAPYIKLSDRGTGANIINPYLLKAGITPESGKGFHALRRSMGTWLIESGSDVSTAAQVLGHMDHNSSKRYISLHYSGLRKCSMGLSGIEVAEGRLL
jgi:site-specific recombinase XerD